MKAFEIKYLCAEPLLPPLHKQVRQRLKQIARGFRYRPTILDVGGRKSHYTIGVPANITIIDLPRKSEIQKKLNLGVNDEIVDLTLARRSNVREVMFGDMTCSSLPNTSFDCVVAVEVLEHVEKDDLFVQEVSRVLKPGGKFLMTTPNGDFVKNNNPDHVRHYKRAQLHSLLASHFAEVQIDYAIQGGASRRYGLKSWSLKRPAVTAMSMVGNIINTIQSADPILKVRERGTHHLIATARKHN